MLTGSEKAVVAFVIAFIGGVVNVLLTQLPDNTTVQLWGGIITGVLTAFATAFGVWQKVNTKPQPAA